jgi:hypothetical protein
MKQALRNLAAILCVLMLGIGSASCMDMASHQPSCSHCAEHQPLHHQTPSCCETHHQPSATATTITLEYPAQLSAAFSPLVFPDALTLEMAASQRIWPPPLLPRLKLRI